MRDKIYITISDIYKTRHFTISQLIKKYILYLGGLITFIIMVLVIATSILGRKVEEYSHYKEENAKLNREIETKEFVLSDVSRKLDEVERITLINETLELSEVTPDKMLETIKLTQNERTRLMSIVPSGQPIKGAINYTSPFGERRHPTTGERSFHTGLDYGAPIGTEVIATSSGVVEYAGVSGAYGRMIILNHGSGFKTVYAHLNEIKVDVGDFVSSKDIIAKSGNTGRSTGPHLHYEVQHLNRRLNPRNFAEWGDKNYESIFQKEGSIKWDSLITMIKKEELAQERE